MKVAWSLLFLLLTACPGTKNREPASLPPSTSVFPVKLICSAPATSEGIFRFSGEGDSLLAEFLSSGETSIRGKAVVLLRDQGDSSSFEGVVDVTGTRSPDAMTYQLEARVRGETWNIELRRSGDSKIQVHGRERSRIYYSNCSDPI